VALETTPHSSQAAAREAPGAPGPRSSSQTRTRLYAIGVSPVILSIVILSRRLLAAAGMTDMTWIRVVQVSVLLALSITAGVFAEYSVALIHRDAIRLWTLFLSRTPQAVPTRGGLDLPGDSVRDEHKRADRTRADGHPASRTIGKGKRGSRTWQKHYDNGPQ